MKQISESISQTILDIFSINVFPELSITEEQFGDVSTNVAMQLAGKLSKSPRDIAELITEKLKNNQNIKEISVVGPGFINIRLSDSFLIEALNLLPSKSWENKVVVCEYSDPNPFKVLHAGHLYTTLVGDVIGNLFEVAGADVKRVNFGGDVGLHVAKAMYGIQKAIGNNDPKSFLSSIDVDGRPEWIAARYVEGNTAYEEDESAKSEIIELNKKVYELHKTGEKNSAFAILYWTCRQWSYDGFEELYKNLGVKKFDKYYPESTTAESGLQAAKEALSKGVLSESDGAVVFKGEDIGLHTRVFINSGGLPTYETKDLGLVLAKWSDYQFDKSVMITANDIVEYMKVVQAVVKTFAPEIAERSQHITHGVVKLVGGQKMSSRKGNVLLAQDVIDSAVNANKQTTGKEDMNVVLGAIKYAFIKNRIGGDVIYDPEESVSLIGNSGPYLQYAHARACSILAKAQKDAINSLKDTVELDTYERLLVKKLGQFVPVVDKAVSELMPHHIASYLYELAQEFNSFYEHNRVIGDERQEIRLALVNAYRETLGSGLAILGIYAPDHM